MKTLTSFRNLHAHSNILGKLTLKLKTLNSLRKLTCSHYHHRPSSSWDIWKQFTRFKDLIFCSKLSLMCRKYLYQLVFQNIRRGRRHKLSSAGVRLPR